METPSQTDDNKDLFIQLPKAFLPGSDRLSKQLLKHNEVIDIVARSLLDVSPGSYTTGDSEWDDGSKSDVFYVPQLANHHSLPPILVEVQQVVDEGFIQRAIGYCLNVVKTYNKLPILLIFCVQNVQPASLRSDFQPVNNGSFLHQIQSRHWAQQCLLIAKHTHTASEGEVSLDPLLAISLFFTEKEPTLATHKHAEDPTIIRLYAIAAEVLDNHLSHKQNFEDVLNTILFTHQKFINKALKEADKRSGDTKKVRKILFRALRYNSQVQQLYTGNDSESSSSTSIDLPPRLPLSDPQSSGCTDAENAFVKKFKRETKASSGRMNWNACLVAGRDQGLFSRYTTGHSLRCWYNRTNE